MSTLRRWESGERVPDANDLKQLATALETSVAYLLMDETDTQQYGNSLEILKKHFDESRKILEAITFLVPEGLDPLMEEQITDPKKRTIIKMLDGLDEEQIRKVHDFLSDQKQLAKLKNRQGT
jgi:transcriptional regulator with XRE-family HTH domain